MSITQPYASRYTHILSLVEEYLIDTRKNKYELPKSRFASASGDRSRGGHDGFWAVLDHMATLPANEVKVLLPAQADFKVTSTLGSGRFGVVEVVKSAYDGELYAMKTINKTSIKRSVSISTIGVERYIHLLARQDRWVPVPALHTAFQSSESLHLVIRLATCGSLWDRMGLEDEPFPFPSPVKCKEEARVMKEDEIRWWGSQMVVAIAWLHDQGYAHRDIKPQNFLIDASARILLTDFGVAVPIDQDLQAAAEHCAVPAGTPDYIAPEVLLAGEAAVAAIWEDQTDAPVYTAAVDHWSLGATVYEMTTGQAPFVARSIAGTYARITSYDLDISKLKCEPALRSLITGLLCPTGHRLDTAQLLQHSFFAGTDFQAIRAGSQTLPSTIPPVSPRGIDPEPSFAQSFSFSFAPRYDYTSPASNFADFTQFIQPLADPHEWLGWTWMPDPAELRHAGQGAASPVKAHEDMYRTPMRQTSAPFRPPPSTAKRVPKQTPGTNPYFDLLKCVHESARKKRASAAVRGEQGGGEVVSIDAVEKGVSKLMDELQGLRDRLDTLR